MPPVLPSADSYVIKNAEEPKSGYHSQQCRQWVGVQTISSSTLSTGTNVRRWARWPGWPPRLRPEDGWGGLRLTCGPPLDGGLEEFCEFWSRCAFRSATSASSLAIRASYHPNTAHNTACTWSGICAHNSTGIGGVRSICVLSYPTSSSLRESDW